MEQLIKHLEELGFTEYESRAYLALLNRNPLNGYELAKLSGIPRPNIYTVLERLLQKGAALAVQMQDGAKYAPVPPQELLNKISRSFQTHLEEASTAMSLLQVSPHADYIWNLKGYDNVIDKARSLIQNAQCQVLLGLWPAEFPYLSDSLLQAEARGVKATLLYFHGKGAETNGRQVFRLPLESKSDTRWLVLTVDDMELLAAEIRPGAETTGAWTRQRLFIYIASWYIRHSIAVAEIVRNLGSKLPSLLDKRARKALSGASLATTNGHSWLDGVMPVEAGMPVISKAVQKIKSTPNEEAFSIKPKQQKKLNGG